MCHSFHDAYAIFPLPAAIGLLMTAAAALVPLLRTARMSIAQVLRYD